MALDSTADITFQPLPELKKRQKDRSVAGLEAEEAAGRLLALKGRTVSLLAVAILLLFLIPFPDVLFYEALIAVFVIAGFGRHLVEALGLYRWWQPYVQIAVDFALLAFILAAPNPFGEYHLPEQMSLRFGTFAYFYVMLVGLAFGYRPLHVIFGGLAGALSWTIVGLWLISLPDTVLHSPAPITNAGEMAALMASPTFVNTNQIIQDVVVFLIVAALLAAVVARSRQLVERQASLERERGNLARYFPPATVDRLARQDAALGQVREQEAAVLFADLVGFTHWSERHAPQEVISLLREVHARLEEEVFRHHGTLDKFIGDGLMATFGTPERSARDALNALRCLKSIAVHFHDWNERRSHRGKRPIRISVGLHYGPVVVGNIGTDRRLELAVLGDTVNVANRLEAMTRELGSTAAISIAAAEAARQESETEAAEALEGFVDCGFVGVRGREETVHILKFG